MAEESMSLEGLVNPQKRNPGRYIPANVIAFECMNVLRHRFSVEGPFAKPPLTAESVTCEDSETGISLRLSAELTLLRVSVCPVPGWFISVDFQAPINGQRSVDTIDSYGQRVLEPAMEVLVASLAAGRGQLRSAERERCAKIAEAEQAHWEMRAAGITGNSEPLKLSYEQDAYMCGQIAAKIRSGE